MEQSEIHKTLLKFTVLYKAWFVASNAPQQLQQLNQRSPIANHHGKYNNNEKMLKYCKNYQDVTQRHNITKCGWKSTKDLLNRGIASSHPFVRNKQNAASVKHSKMKHNKSRYVCIQQIYDFCSVTELSPRHSSSTFYGPDCARCWGDR